MRAGWYLWQGATSASVGGGKVSATEVLGEEVRIPRLVVSAFDAGTGVRLWSFQRRFNLVPFESHVYFPWAPTYVELPGGKAR